MLRGNWLAVVLIALVALIPTGKFVLGGLVPAPVDQVHQLPPWNAPKPNAPWDVLQLDGALQFLPWRDFMLQARRDGAVPLWNPYAFAGAPFLGNSQSAPLYPLHLIWPFDAESLLSFSAWLHLFIAGVGVYLLCRRLGASFCGGLLGGSAMSLCAFMVAWIELPSVGMTAAWIPWALLGVARLFDQPTPKSAAKLAASVGLMLLAGHLQIAAYGLIATVLFALWLLFEPRPRAASEAETTIEGWESEGGHPAPESIPEVTSAPPPQPKLKLAALCLASLVLGAFLSAPQTLTAIESGRFGHRASAPTSEGWDAYKASALTPKHLATLVTPRVFGEPNVPLAGEPKVTSYWLALEEPGRHYAELAFYLGPAALPLAVLALFRRSRRRRLLFFPALAAIGVLIALGTAVAKLLYDYLPGWAATGSPGRAAILCAVGLCIFAGAALPEDDAEEPGPSFLPAAALVALAILGIAAASTFSSLVPAQFINLLPHSPTDGGLQLAAASLLALLALRYRRARPVAIAGLIALQIATLTAVHWNTNPGSPRGLAAQSFPGLEILNGKTVAVVNSSWSLFTAPKEAIAPPNSLLPYRIKELGGYDSLIRRVTKEKLDQANGQDSAPPANGNMMFIKPTADTERLRALGADFIISAIDLGLPKEADFGNWAIYRLPGEKPASFVAWERYNQRALKWSGKDRIEARAWLSTEDADGWEMDPTTYDLPTRTVVAEYRPHSYRLGILLFLVGISALFALSCIRENRL
jgi:hypothetical protein